MGGRNRGEGSKKNMAGEMSQTLDWGREQPSRDEKFRRTHDRRRDERGQGCYPEATTLKSWGQNDVGEDMWRGKFSASDRCSQSSISLETEFGANS